MTVTIRDAAPEDADAIADLHVRACQVACRGIVPDTVLDHPDHERSRHDWWQHRLDVGPNPAGDLPNRIFVGEMRERVVGFGHAGHPSHETDIEHGEIHAIYVHPDAWGTGAADALMAACLAELRTRCTFAESSVLRDNPRARRFFERTGWSLVVDQKRRPVETLWGGPFTPGVELPEPLPVVQYHIDFT